MVALFVNLLLAGQLPASARAADGVPAADAAPAERPTEANAPQSLSAEQQRRVDSLIRQLGARQYTSREAAMRALEEVGVGALPQLRLATGDDDLEVRYRARSLVKRIERQDHARRIELLRSQGTAAEDSLLPGLKQFRATIGSSPASLETFADMHAAMPDLMWTLDDHSAASQLQFEHCLAELQYRWRNRTDDGQRTVTLYAILFLAAQSGRELTPQMASLLSGFVSSGDFRKLVEKSKPADVPSRLLAAWVRKDAGDNHYRKLTLAMRYNLKEGLIPALRLLKNPGNGSYAQSALLAVARFGNRSHLSLVETLLDDETVLSMSRRKNQVVWSVQVRDVALVTALHLCGEKPRDFGFEKLRDHATYVYQYSSAGFDNPEKRKAVFARWAEYRKQHPDD